MENVKKISVALLRENEVDSAVIVGRIVKTGIKETQYGDSVRFAGDFIADVGAGKYRSNVLYVPEVLESALAVAVINAGENGTVDFAVRLEKKSSKASPAGFVWSFTHLVEPSTPDPIAQLMEQVTVVPKLPAKK